MPQSLQFDGKRHNKPHKVDGFQLPVCKALAEKRICKEQLHLSFESSDFREGWQGVIVFRFTTDKALSFQKALIAIGAQQGIAAEADKSRR